MDDSGAEEERRFSVEHESRISFDADLEDVDVAPDVPQKQSTCTISWGFCPVAGVILGAGTLILLATILYIEAINGDKCLLAQEKNVSISCEGLKLSSNQAITAAIGAFSATSTLCAGLVELLYKSPVFIEGYFNDKAFGQRVELVLVILLTVTAVVVNLVVLLQAMTQEHTQNFISSSIGIVIVVPGIIAILTTAGVATIAGKTTLLPK